MADDTYQRKLMAQKLSEHLANLDQVEEALRLDPGHTELQKLKVDLTEVIKLISKQMLQKSIAAKSSNSVSSEPRASQIGKSSNHAKECPDKNSSESADDTKRRLLLDLEKLATLPNLPSFFHEKWNSKYTHDKSQPKSSTSTSATANSPEKNSPTTEEKPNKYPGRTSPGVPSRSVKDMSIEQIRERRTRRKINCKRNRKVKSYISMPQVNGEQNVIQQITSSNETEKSSIAKSVIDIDLTKTC